MNQSMSFCIKIMFYQLYESTYLNFTLVQHPVGRHLDVFSDSKLTLDNRALFSYELNNHNKSLWLQTQDTDMLVEGVVGNINSVLVC